MSRQVSSSITPGIIRESKPNDTLESMASGVQSSLSKALAFHASFDHGPDADFAIGDKQIYTAARKNIHSSYQLTPGLGDPSLSIVEGRGKFGAALEFTKEKSHIVLYKCEKNVAYSPEMFRGTASFWLSLDPSEIPGQYADPFQLTDKNFSEDCLWIDFTKNDTPSDFRLGAFGNRSSWDVKDRGNESEEFFWRLLKIAEPPFAKSQWTHVVITWDGVNSSTKGRARLYLNGEYRGATGSIHERFTWDISGAGIRLGVGPFVGLIDDIAIFSHPLIAEEIDVLYRLEWGVTELYR